MKNPLFKKRLLAKDVMSVNIVTIEPKATLIEAGKKMKANRIDNLLVVEKNTLKGIITSSDIVRRALAEGKAARTLVKDIMTSPVKYVSTDDQLLHVVDKMLLDNTKRFPVMDLEKKELVGIVTIKDILRTIPNHLLDKIEWLRIHPGGEAKNGKRIKGVCEVCGKFTNDLRFSKGLWVCRDCE